jgi:hypothetical protein
VLVTQQVQKPVHQKAPQFLLKGNPLLPRLLLGAHGVYDDVPQEDLAFHGEAPGQVVQGEGEDVGGVVPAAVGAVQLPHPLGTGQKDAKFCPL